MNGRVVYASGFGSFETGEAPDSRADQVICLQNIGPAEQRKRLRFGLVGLAAGLAIGALLILTGMNPWLRLILFLPFSVGAIGFFQSRDKT